MAAIVLVAHVYKYWKEEFSKQLEILEIKEDF